MSIDTYKGRVHHHDAEAGVLIPISKKKYTYIPTRGHTKTHADTYILLQPYWLGKVKQTLEKSIYVIM
jgi:hypothetical protein